MGGKGRGMWGSMLKEGLRAGMLKRILGGKVGDKTLGKYRELREVDEEKEVRESQSRHN